MAGIKLAAFDLEGCLTDDPTVWEIMHTKCGTWESHGLVYWERFKRGELHYDEFARLDVAAWGEAPRSLFEQAVAEVPVMPGATELIRLLRLEGVTVAIISNGLMHVAERFREAGAEHVFANRIITRNSRLTGELDLCMPFDGKGEVLRALAVRLGVTRDETAAIGDSVQDVGMFSEARVSVAFCTRHPEVAEAATHVVREKDMAPLADILLAAE